MNDILRAVSASGHHEESGGDQWPECQLWRFSFCLGNHARTRSGGQRNRTQFLSLPPRAILTLSWAGIRSEFAQRRIQALCVRARKKLSLTKDFFGAINCPMVQDAEPRRVLENPA